jgi:glyoxylase-like metal-dependent hydrolase (beta-lactamase superfamily II)
MSTMRRREGERPRFQRVRATLAFGRIGDLPEKPEDNDRPKSGRRVMSKLTRRGMLSGAAGAAVATALAPLIDRRAFAAAPVDTKQAPGVYRYKVGDFEISVVTDGAATFPLPEKFVQNHPKADVQAALAAYYQPTETVTIPFNPIVINTGAKLVLVDTGYGPEMNAKTNGRVGQLPANLAAAGIDPKSIDTVIISHMHLDHVSGLRTADGSIAFPNATIFVPAGDWAFWMNDAEMNKLPEGYTKSVYPGIRKVFAGLEDKVTKYDGGKELVTGITTVATPGHTPGHISFVVASGSAKVLVQSDVTNIPHLFLRNPDWQVMYDVDPLTAAATRKKFYDIAAAEKALIQGFHFPFPSAGHVEKEGAQYRLVPVPWNPII